MSVTRWSNGKCELEKTIFKHHNLAPEICDGIWWRLARSILWSELNGSSGCRVLLLPKPRNSGKPSKVMWPRFEDWSTRTEMMMGKRRNLMNNTFSAILTYCNRKSTVQKLHFCSIRAHSCSYISFNCFALQFNSVLKFLKLKIWSLLDIQNTFRLMVV